MSELSIPKYTKTKSENPELRLGFKWSLAGHLFLTLLILVKSSVFPGKRMPYISTLKVDLVGLPNVLKKDLVNAQQNQVNLDISHVLKQAEDNANKIKLSIPSHPTAQKDELVLHPHPTEITSKKNIETKNRLALDRLKALAKIQDTQSDENEDPPKIHGVLGNQVSPGSSLTGEAKEAATESYLDILRDRIHDNFTIPVWIQHQNFTAQVQIYLDARGKLQGHKFLSSSGNPQFDEAIERALRNSQPLPFPPKELVGSFLKDGITLGFPL